MSHDKEIPFASRTKTGPAPFHRFSLKLWLALWAFIALGMSGSPALAATGKQASDANLKAVRAMLEQPDKQMDLGKIKLTIDRMIDPGIDIADGIKQLDAMAAEVRARLPANPSSRDKLEALRTYLYQAGPWNDNRPFRYDLDDPLGRDIRNKLLTTYLSTRKGNCVSMPLLFIILGQKIGLDVIASTAPEHVFVKYRDDTGTLYNLETTSGAGFTRDVWMRKQLPMTDEALASGIYMQPLSKKETVVMAADILDALYARQGLEEQRIALAELALKHYPKYVDAMLHISAANWRLRERHFVSKYPTPNDIPMQERAYFVQLDQGIGSWRAKAEALGWREPDQPADASNQQTADRAKPAQ